MAVIELKSATAKSQLMAAFTERVRLGWHMSKDPASMVAFEVGRFLADREEGILELQFDSPMSLSFTAEAAIASGAMLGVPVEALTMEDVASGGPAPELRTYSLRLVKVEPGQ